MEEKKHCKWYNDEFCTNDKSPCVADYCPVVEYPELCKCREFDKDINVRSKDDTDKDTAKEILQGFYKWLNQAISDSYDKSVKGSYAYQGGRNNAFHEVKNLVKKVAESKGVEVE